MLGWYFSVCRQKGDGTQPADPHAEQGECLATWQARIRGLDWIEELIELGQCKPMHGYGYPYRTTAQARFVLPQILKGPPHAREHFTAASYEIVVGKPHDGPLVHKDRILACPPDDWLIIQIFDES